MRYVAEAARLPRRAFPAKAITIRGMFSEVNFFPYLLATYSGHIGQGTIGHDALDCTLYVLLLRGRPEGT